CVSLCVCVCVCGRERERVCVHWCACATDMCYSFTQMGSSVRSLSEQTALLPSLETMRLPVKERQPLAQSWASSIPESPALTSTSLFCLQVLSHYRSS